MWCATATASDELLMHQIRDLLDQIGEPENQTVKKYFARRTRSTAGTKPFAFHRSTLTDSDVIETLVDELGKNRGLKLNHDHIALISEWDTFYGRALPITFKSRVPQKILTYHYLRGIDGRLPDTSPPDTAKTEDTTKKDEGKKQSSLAREMTEGLNQADYLRRLARELVEQNEGFRRTGESEIKAVGVLGSDVYDKLLVMEALRNSLPNAIFFTTSLDARLAHPDQWRWTRNLLVGSPFGLSLSEQYQDVPPFRESSQTAWYTATLLAAGNPALKKFPKIVDALRPVRLYEIGRKGAFDLTPRFTSGNRKRPQPPNVDMKRWLTLKRGILILCIGLVAVLAIAWSVAVILKDRSATKGGATSDRSTRKGGEISDTAFLRILGSPWSVFVIVGFVSVTLVWMISSCYKAFEGEPYSWNDGISIWPTETLRLLAALLSVFYIWRISTELWRSEQQVESKFGLPRYHKSRHRIRVRIRWLRLKVEDLSVSPRTGGPGGPVKAGDTACAI